MLCVYFDVVAHDTFGGEVESIDTLADLFGEIQERERLSRTD